MRVREQKSADRNRIQEQCKGKREVAKVKQKVYGELYERMDCKEGEKDLY